MPTFQLELVTPEHVVLSERVQSVRVPGSEGSFGVLAGHAPLMSALTVGLVKVVHENGDEEFIAASGGFVEVGPEKVIVLADAAERAEEIDVARAEAAVSRARQRLNSGEAIDYPRAQAALARAMNRLKAAHAASEKR
jgi:F-type H+-transporting ATPase subunit epsilon